MNYYVIDLEDAAESKMRKRSVSVNIYIEIIMKYSYKLMRWPFVYSISTVIKLRFYKLQKIIYIFNVFESLFCNLQSEY